MILLRICWAIDLLALLIALYVFVDGLATVAVPEPAFFGAWFFLLGLPVLGLAGSYWLMNHGHMTWAMLLAAVPAVPAILTGVWSVILLFESGRWA